MANDMSNAIDMLKDMLNSPDAGEKIGSILSALGGGSDENENPEAALPDLSSIASMLTSTGDKKKAEKSPDLTDLPIANIMKIATAYQKLSKEDDPRINLLSALRPYMRHGRQNSVDTAIKLLGLLKLAPLLGDLKEVL